MTLENARKYRRYQVFGLTSSVFIQGVAAYALAVDGATVMWSVLSLCALAMVLLALRAAKLEALEYVGISLPVYEQLIVKAWKGKK